MRKICFLMKNHQNFTHRKLLWSPLFMAILYLSRLFENRITWSIEGDTQLVPARGAGAGKVNFVSDFAKPLWSASRKCRSRRRIVPYIVSEDSSQRPCIISFVLRGAEESVLPVCNRRVRTFPDSWLLASQLRPWAQLIAGCCRIATA